MNMYYNIASTYGSNAYNTSDYNGTTTSGSTSGSAGGSSAGGVLTDTGIAIAGFVTIACLIVLTAVVIRIWKRPSRKLAMQAAEPSETHEE